MKRPGHEAAVAAAVAAAARSSNAKLADALREHAADIEGEGRAWCPSWMREAADRLTDHQEPYTPAEPAETPLERAETRVRAILATLSPLHAEDVLRRLLAEME